MVVLWLILIGLISGIISGMGLGGGTIMIPALTIFLGIPQTVAQGINLLAFIPSAIVAIIIHSKNGFIRTKNILWIILPGLIFSVVGASLTNYIPRNIVRIVFGCFLIAIAVWQFITFFMLIKNKK
ncbi:MAG: sulfite exporter TauE/SafE family protein [Christensenellales bacterium]